MLCVLILYISGGTYSLKSTANDRFFEKLFMTIIITVRVFARNLLRGNRRRNTFRILFWCLACGSYPGFTSNKPTHYLLDYGDFVFNLVLIGYLEYFILGSKTPAIILISVLGHLCTTKNYAASRLLDSFLLLGSVRKRFPKSLSIRSVQETITVRVDS